MHKSINKDVLSSTLTELGWTQSQLAKAVGVSSQSVTNWVKGVDFPRPATLLKLATTLKLDFEKLVMVVDEGQPVVAFRKKGNAKTTEEHISKAAAIGMLLKPLVPYLPELQALRTLITSPSTDYEKLQLVVSQTRANLGIGEQAALGYENLIGEFNNCGAVLIPVLKGARKSHENALHIRLPKEDVTFIFLNLDTRLEDFKFWMAHELAHVYTPKLSGTNEGENFADTFAGALLFPKACAEPAYSETVKKATAIGKIEVLQQHANKHMISLNTVFQQVKDFSKAAGLPVLPVEDKAIHMLRNINHGSLISNALFDPMPPEPKLYMATCEHGFQSDFFNALKRMIRENGIGPSYIQQVLDTSLQDAMALHEVMSH